MSSIEQKQCAFGASFSNGVKFFNENSFTQETNFLVSRKITDLRLEYQGMSQITCDV